MLIGALAAGAVSKIADALTTQGQTQFPAPDSKTADAKTASAQSLIAPQPSDGETTISKASAKILADLKSLLLSVQAQQSDISPRGVKANTLPATSPASTA